MEVLATVKKETCWSLCIVEYRNGNIELIVTNWEQPKQNITLSIEDGHYKVLGDEITNKYLKNYISKHRVHLYHLLAIYRTDRLLNSSPSESSTKYLESRLKQHNLKLERNLKGHVKI